MPETTTPPPSPDVTTDPACAICGTPRSQFKTHDAKGRPFKDAQARGRLCSGCGSGERQRVFSELLQRGMGRMVPMRDADIFAIAPTRSERRVLDSVGIGSLTTADIRPEVKADVVVNVCDMPHVESDRYDVVLASYVLTCVYDLGAALSEFRRILKPGGALLSTDPEAVGEPIVENTDLDRITAWYGREAYEKYRIGAFRRIGELDFPDRLGEHFCPQTHVGIDGPTGARIVWHASIKH